MIALEESDRCGRQSFTDVASYSKGPQLGEWLIPTFNRRLIDAAEDAGIRLERVSGKQSSQIWHSCTVELNQVSERLVQCANESCPVGSVDRNRKALQIGSTTLDSSHGLKTSR